MKHANVLRFSGNAFSRRHIDIQIRWINIGGVFDACVHGHIVRGERRQRGKPMLGVLYPFGVICPFVLGIGNGNRRQILEMLLVMCGRHVPEDQETGRIQCALVLYQIADLIMVRCRCIAVELVVYIGAIDFAVAQFG